jgi:PAS domain S-box-containing protein
MTWNRGAERLFGYIAEEAVGRSVTMLIPPERHDEEPGILARIRRGERIEHYETVRRSKDGHLLDISLTVSPIIDAHGRIVGASKIARDVTERRQAATRLAVDQEAMARLYDIGRRCAQAGDHFIENLSAMLETAIWIMEADRGNVQLYDPASRTMALVVQRGFEASFVERFASVGHDAHLPYGAAMAAGERFFVEDVAMTRAFGAETVDALLEAGVRAFQSTPLVSSAGTALGMISTHFGRPHRPDARQCRLLDVLARQAADYIERKNNEEQREELLHAADRSRREAEDANRAKDEFLAMLGHELRNPLSAVRNAIAAATLDESARSRALEIARRQTDQLGRIVDDLLDVARITRGRVPLRRERVLLADLLQRAVDGARALMDERGHALTLTVPTDAVQLDADPARLEQAIANLLTNAAKYTDPGGTITLVGERDGDDAVIRVRDDGMGIPSHQLPYVFDLFAQGERALDRAQGGLGIGLTLVRRIAELHGGTVEARSEGLGRGAEFTIRLPAVTHAGAESVVTLPVAQSRPREPQHPARVLMVEDNPDAAESLVMILELLGHHVRVVHNGPAALATALANVPDIMLVDIGLPGMDGYQVAQAIRREPSLKHLLLVALTGYGRPEDKQRAMAAGFDYHLVKPVDLDALGDLVSRLGSPSRSTIPARDSETRH